MLALVVTVPASEAELASDALWALGVAANEERPADGDEARTEDRFVELWTSLGTDIDAPWPLPAGVAGDGSILVFLGLGEDVATTTLQAFDPVTLGRRPASDVTIPAPATFAWQGGGLLTWIGVDGSLHVGDQVVPGRFRWARPAG